MQLTEPNMPSTHEPYTPADNSIKPPPPSTTVTRQRFFEEDLQHVLTAIDLYSSVIYHVIIDNGIQKIQILLSMKEYQLANMTSLNTGEVNTILILQGWVQWYQKQSNDKLPNWKRDFNYDAFYEYFMDDKYGTNPFLGDLKSQTSAVNSTSTG